LCVYATIWLATSRLSVPRSGKKNRNQEKKHQSNAHLPPDSYKSSDNYWLTLVIFWAYS